MSLLEMVQPSYASCPDYEYTYGPAVVELCKLTGFIPDPEQELALDWIFAVGQDGKPIAFEFAIVACRQNIKSALFEMAALGWLFITDQQLIVWSAHEFGTSKVSHRHLAGLIKACPPLDARVKEYYWGNGNLAIELHPTGGRETGARIEFKTRTDGGGRGLSGDKVILDEAFALQAAHMGGLVPLLRARPEPQLLYGSSAPKSDSRILHKLQKRGRAGISTRLAYLEYSAPEGGCAAARCEHEFGIAEGCALDNRDNWQRANTALGRRITLESMQAERELLPPLEFARELLGWPDAEAGSVTEPIYGEGKWEACAVDAGESRAETRRCFGLAVSFDRTHACIGMAGEARWPDARGPHLEITGVHLEPIAHRRGLAWVPKEAKRLQVEHGFPFIVDGRGPAKSLIPDLLALDVEVIVADANDVLDAYAMLYDHVQDATVRHMSYPELDGAVAGATPRDVGDRKALGRKTSDCDVSPLEAVQLAAWGSWSGHGTDYDLMNSFF